MTNRKPNSPLQDYPNRKPNSPLQGLASSATQKPNSPLQDYPPIRRLVDYSDSDEEVTPPNDPTLDEVFQQDRGQLEVEDPAPVVDAVGETLRLVDYSDSDEEVTPPNDPTLDEVFQQIRCCVDLETLQFFILSGAWVGNPAVRKAIQSRYYELDSDGRFKHQFACEEFW